MGWQIGCFELIIIATFSKRMIILKMIFNAHICIIHAVLCLYKRQQIGVSLFIQRNQYWCLSEMFILELSLPCTRTSIWRTFDLNALFINSLYWSSQGYVLICSSSMLLSCHKFTPLSHWKGSYNSKDFGWLQPSRTYNPTWNLVATQIRFPLKYVFWNTHHLPAVLSPDGVSACQYCYPPSDLCSLANPKPPYVWGPICHTVWYCCSGQCLQMWLVGDYICGWRKTPSCVCACVCVCVSSCYLKS